LAEISPKTYSLAHASAELGVHRNTLAKWIEQGCPVAQKADRSRGVEWKIALPVVFAWRIDRAVSEAVASYQDDNGKITKDEADRRRAIALAVVSEVEADEALDTVVARQDAEGDLGAFCLVLKTALSHAAAKIAARAAAVASAPEIQELCETELNRAFDSAKGELAARWTDDPAQRDNSGEDQ
jgi:terminase small subunit / prophage DNA-packing protein